MTSQTAPNLLLESGRPIAYSLAERDLLHPPETRGFAVALRTAVRSLTVMQKEAVVVRTDGTGWRLASDEGPYLQGHDFAPAPLAYLATGLAADLLGSVESSLRATRTPTAPLRVVVDCRFTMEGSLPRGTMVGGALPPEITVFAPNAESATTTGSVMSGVLSSVTAAIARSALTSRFTLTSHGVRVPVARVTHLDEIPLAQDTRPAAFPSAHPTSGDPIVTKTWDVGEHPGDSGSSLQPEQRRQVHLRAEATRRGDGIAVIDVSVHRPNGSTFRFLSEEPVGRGGQGRAPDALTYLSAGIGFCFMTQIGRYAKILQRTLGDYHIIQDTRFSRGDVTANPPVAGRADDPRTHVYLAPDDEEFAAAALDMSEQTCFIHAMCRTELRPKVKTLSHR